MGWDGGEFDAADGVVLKDWMVVMIRGRGGRGEHEGRSRRGTEGWRGKRRAQRRSRGRSGRSADSGRLCGCLASPRDSEGQTAQPRPQNCGSCGPSQKLGDAESHTAWHGISVAARVGRNNAESDRKKTCATARRQASVGSRLCQVVRQVLVSVSMTLPDAGSQERRLSMADLLLLDLAEVSDYIPTRAHHRAQRQLRSRRHEKARVR